ncbi:MAG: site-2 protease family protein [Proteobacteria bacterium]|nr:site-2 protease family protein [Pseudomonadota bacterium]MBU1641426.1 site-2 protease family protein [Pseudomonadota bacterium]
MFNINFQDLVIQVPVFLFALTIHEFSHGYVASLCGDQTARMLGRLTLNPLKHLDPIGTLAIFLIHFGWAKPVPVDPRNFRNPRRDMILVSLAGPMANFATMVVSLFALFAIASLSQAIPAFLSQPLIAMFSVSIWINSILAIFNLIPIPPLDGSKILMGLLPAKQARSFARLEGAGFILIMILVFTGVLGKFIVFVQRLLFSFFTG